jgi:hypothetical protein
MVRLGSKVGMVAAALLAPLVAAAQTPPAAPSAEMTRQQIQEMRQAAQAARGGPEGARDARGGRGGARQGGRGDFQGGNIGGGGFQGGFPGGGQRGGGFAATARAPVEAAAPAAPLVIPVVSAPAASAPVAAGRSAAGADPLAGLGGKVTAVLAISTAPRLLINENDHGVIDTRDLAVGDEYRDGWRLASVNTTSVTMRKGEEQRQVALNINTGVGRTPASGGAGAITGAGGAAAATAAPGRGAMSLSNGNQAAGGRGGAQTAQGLDGAALATLFGQRIDPAQAQALAGQFQAEMQRGLASLPPEIANDPRAAAAISALQNGNLGDVLSQFQGALGGFPAQAGGGGASAPPVFLFGGRGQ